MAKRLPNPAELQAAIDGGRLFIDAIKQLELPVNLEPAILAKLTLTLDSLQSKCNRHAIKMANEEIAADVRRQEVEHYAIRTVRKKEG